MSINFKWISIPLPESVLSLIVPLMRSKGFKNRSEYIRDLIVKDSGNTFSKRAESGSIDELHTALKDLEIKFKSDLETAKSEIFQRLFILTRINMQVLADNGKITADNLQKSLDKWIAEAKSKYPTE